MALLSAQLLLLAAAIASASPVTLYVSSSSGSDAAPGTAPSTPFATLQRAAAAAAALGPGGACAGILLLRGDAWTLAGAWTLSGLRGASAAQPLVLGSYGAAARRPRLLRQAPAAGPTLLLDNCSAVALQGLEVVGGENGVAFTFDVQGAQVPTVYEGFAVTDCFFNQIGGLSYNASSGSWWGSAIAFAARHAGVQVRGVTIASNLVNGSDVFYSNSVPYSGFTRAYVSHLNISSNAITHCGYNVLFLDSTSFVLVESNAFLHDTPPRLFVAGTTDVIMGTLNASVTLRGNEFAQRGEYQPGGPDGCSIDFETNATGVTFSGNYISRSFGAGVMVFGHVDGSNTALQLTNNTILHSGCGQTRGDHGGIAFMRKGSSGLLAGNVLASCPGVPALNDALDPGLPGWQQAGNVIDGQGGAAVAACAVPVVSAAPAAGGGLRIDAALGSGGALPCRLTYSLTGAPPGPDAPAFPAGGLDLPPQWRALAVLVKAWPSAAAAAAAPGVTSVPSESAGGVFAP